MNDIKKELQAWIFAEQKAGRNVDFDRISEWLQAVERRHNSTPRNEFNGLSPEEMYNLLYYPFGSDSIVRLKKLEIEQYFRIPLVRQSFFLLETLGKTELKLTKLGWLPLKIVAQMYPLGQPVWIIEELHQKRINEYDVKSVSMARIILELLGWIKTRKGMLSLTAKGKKALSDIDAAVNEILLCALIKVGLGNFDGVEDDRIGNEGIAYSVLLLNKFGSKWHSGGFYQEYYQKVFSFPDSYNIYATRVFSRLFYWLGLVEKRPAKGDRLSFDKEYRKTELLSMIFSFGKE